MDQGTRYASSVEAINMRLETTQKIIERMASNSASCKMWSVTLVSALLVVVKDLTDVRYLIVAVTPIICFSSLDAYYLSLEKIFRAAYNSFVIKAAADQLQPDDFCITTPSRNWVERFIRVVTCLRSFSVWPFYSSLLAVAIILYFLMGSI